MQAGRHGSSAQRIQWATGFVIQGEWWLEKPTSSFLGVPAPPWYRARCVFKSADGWSWNPCPWSEYECRPNPIPHPMTWGNSHTSTSQASLPCSNGSLEQLTYCDLPKSPKFPFLSMVPYWDFCYLRLLHPYHYHYLSQLVDYSHHSIKFSFLFPLCSPRANYVDLFCLFLNLT